MVFPSDEQRVADPDDHYGYLKIDQAVTPITLEEIVAQEDLAAIDILKLDCEGCEHSVLGTAEADVLQRIRFIVGEYHGFDRFTAVMRGKLFATHKVNLVGDREFGCFFAERRDEARRRRAARRQGRTCRCRGRATHRRNGMPSTSAMCSAHERYCHGLA